MEKYNWFQRNIFGLREIPEELTQDEYIENKYIQVKKEIYNLLNAGISKYEQKEFFKILKKIENIQTKAKQR